MRRSDIVFTIALLPVDFLMLVAAAFTAYGVRYAPAVQRVRPVVFDLRLSDYFNYSLLFALAWIAIFAMSGLYAIHKERKIADDVAKVALACSTGTLLVILAFFFSRELFTSRFIIIAVWVLAIIYVMIGRLCMRMVRRALWKSGWGIHEVAVVGDDAAAHALLQSPLSDTASGHCIIVHARHWDDEGRARFEHHYAQGGEVNELILTDPDATRGQIKALMEFCIAHQIVFKYSIELTGMQTTNFGVDMIAGIPVIEIKSTRLDGWGKVVKRVFDIAASAAGLLIIAPFCAVVGMIIKVSDGGPVFVRLIRIGARGQKFSLYKFRSMVVGAEAMKDQLMPYNERADGPLFKMAHDPRITRIGRYLRRTSIDELPQLWNVLKGDMSLVGPRPHEPQEVAKYEAQNRRLLYIRPGITGMAQVSGRSDLTFSDEARIDTFYIQNWSFLLDLIILIKTPLVVLKRSGV